jgi:protease YdgD
MRLIPQSTMAAILLFWASAAQAQLVAADPATSAYASSSIGRLNNGTGGYCSAALVGPDLAVTAAHCLYNFRTKRWIAPDSLHLLLGFDRGNHEFHGRVARYRMGRYDPQQPSETAGADWALLRLDRSVPEPYAHLGQAKDVEGRRFRAAGFGSPRKYRLSVSEECILSRRGGLAVSRCSSAPGMSGGPLIDTSTGELLGIQVGRSGEKASSILIAVPASAWEPSLRLLE